MKPLASGWGRGFASTWPQQGLVRPPTQAPGLAHFRDPPRVSTGCLFKSTCSADVPSSQHGRNHPHLCGREPVSGEVRGFSAPWPQAVSPLPGRKSQSLTLGFKRTLLVRAHLEALLSFSFSSFLAPHPQNSVAVASIHFPLAGPPLSSPALQSVDNSTCKLQFIVFRNGKLFPCTGNSSNLADDGKRRSVSTPVAFTKLGKSEFRFFIYFRRSGRDVNAACLCAGIRAHTRSQCATRWNGKAVPRGTGSEPPRSAAFHPGEGSGCSELGAESPRCPRAAVARTRRLCCACMDAGARALAHFPTRLHCLSVSGLSLQMAAASGASCTPSLSLSGTSRWV